MGIGSIFKPIATGLGKAASYLQNNDAARMMAAGALGAASPRYGPQLAAHLRPEDEGAVVDAPVVSPSEQILQGPGGESGAGYAGGGGGGFGPEPVPMKPFVGGDFERLEPLNLPLAERSGPAPMPRPGPGPLMQEGIPGQEQRGGFPWDRLDYGYGGGRY